MGFLSRLLGLFGGLARTQRDSAGVDQLTRSTPATQLAPSAPAKAPAPAAAEQQFTLEDLGLTLTVKVHGMPDLSGVEVTDQDVDNALATCRFVLDRRLDALKTADQWWNEEVHNRRVKDSSAKATAWLEPFVPPNIIQTLPLASATNPRGPLAAGLVTKELRAAIRERRKAKQAHEELLRALHAACVLESFVKELPFEFVYANQLACHLSLEDWRAARLEYEELGYERLPALGKNDVKWLVGAFGAPRAHQAPSHALAPLRETAITRYCWSELNRENETFRSKNPMSMEAWLRQRLAGTVRIRKENEALMARRMVRRERDERVFQDLPRAWAATKGEFVVADLETTGFSADSDDILEFGAIRVSAEGTVVSEFSMLVDVGYELPPLITRLTGISTQEMRRNGRPLPEALKKFTEFAGQHPVFFHNSYFDEGFLAKAEKRAGGKLAGPVFDTLMLAKAAWPDSDSLKLKDLTERVGAAPPAHRGVPDARAALAVLLAAREQVMGTKRANQGARTLN